MRWAFTVHWAAWELRRHGAPHRSEDALTVAAVLFAGSQQPALSRTARESRVGWLLERAAAEGGLNGAHLVQMALDEATESGLAELAALAKSKLRDAVKAATASMKSVSFDIRLSGELVALVDEVALRSSTPVAAVRSLASVPWLTRMPVAQIEKAAREEAETLLLLHMMPFVGYRDGKVSTVATSSEEKLREAMSRHASIYLAHARLTASHFLSLAFKQFDSETLLRSIGNPSWLDARKLPWLARASERFAAQDSLSCGAILLPLYAGILRDLVRAAGYHAVKYDAGLTQDETLNSLPRVEAVRELLGEEHAWFVEFFLCRSDMGPNLRNEQAHGNLD